MFISSINVIQQTERFGHAYNEIFRNGEGLLIKRYLKPGQTIFDVGANLGEWSLTALQIEPYLRVVCFEPIKVVYDKLLLNLGSKTDMIYNVAVSDHLGENDLYYLDADDSGLSSLYNRPVFSRYDLKVVKVPLETLDHFTENQKIDKIDFLKIDVEGNELNVLNGSTNLINSQKIKAIQFEYGETFFDAGVTLQHVMKLLTHAGYAIFRIYPEGLIHMSHWGPHLENYRYCNYFALVQSEAGPYGPMSF